MTSARIIFMGTPEFAVPSLSVLIEKKMNVISVVTTPDKPSGRGLHINQSPVKILAQKHNLPILQPESLRDKLFIQTIEDLKPDIIVVVAFRKIPDEIIKIPTLGAFNLHASLLPQYRGAAPIHHAVMNGEKESGLTTFLLNDKIDQGDIILQEKIIIPEDMITSELHDIMKNRGAELVIKTIEALVNKNYTPLKQEKIIPQSDTLKKAPKLTKELCKINWENTSEKIYNHIRGLAYTPGAFTHLTNPEGKTYILKLFRSKFHICKHNFIAGTIETDGNTYIKVYTSDGFLYLTELQLEGKKIMTTDTLLRGFKLHNGWKIS